MVMRRRFGIRRSVAIQVWWFQERQMTACRGSITAAKLGQAHGLRQSRDSILRSSIQKCAFTMLASRAFHCNRWQAVSRLSSRTVHCRTMASVRSNTSHEERTATEPRDVGLHHVQVHRIEQINSMVRVIDLKIMDAETGVKVWNASAALMSLQLTIDSSSYQDNGLMSSLRVCQRPEASL